MQNPLAFLNSIQLGKPGKVLVLHTDGYALTLALVQFGAGGPVVRAVGRSRQLEPSEALAEAIEGLKATGVRRLPKTAILVTGQALTALLALPVDPEHPRPKDQMHELVRWELESLFSEQGLRWTIGAHLQGRGYLTPEQRTAVAERQADADLDADLVLPGDTSAPRSKPRFGELAVEMGFATREQVEECLALREVFLPDDDQLVCGWTAQMRPLEDELEDDDEGAAGFPWFALAVPEGLLRTWVRACKRREIFLDAAYGTLGIGFGLLDLPSDVGDALYLEVHREQFVSMRGHPGALRSLRVAPTRDGELDLEDAASLCREELSPDVARLYLRAPVAQMEPLREALARLLELEVLPAGGEAAPEAKDAASVTSELPAAVVDGILAAARHRLGVTARDAQPSVSAQPPKPPLWKRKELAPYAAAAAVVLGVIGYDTSLRIETWQNRAELEELEDRYVEQLEIKEIANQILTETNRLKTQVAEQERAVATLADQVSGLERLANRRAQLPKVLTQIAAACNDEMYIQSIKLPPSAGSLVEMRGWALTNTGAQLFVTTLNNTIDDLKGTVRNSRIVSAPGPRNLPGYQIEVWLSFSEGFGA